MSESKKSERFGRKFQEKGKHETIIRLKEAIMESFKDFLPFFNDPKTTEIYRNPDGKVWQILLGEPKRMVGRMDDTSAMNFIRNSAGASSLVVTTNEPRFDTEFLIDGSRIAASIPPVSKSPSFNIRKKALMVFSLDQYVEDGIMTPEQRDALVRAVTAHRNILLIGGTGSGKTTLVNAVIMEISRQFPNERPVILEDTEEIQCVSEDYLQLHTAPMADPPVTMTTLVKHSLRVKPDRIHVGELRGGEALDLLKAWNTGHMGGVTTLHANSAMDGLVRLKSLVSENEAAPEYGIEGLIGAAVQVVLFIGMVGEKRVVHEVIELDGWDESRGRYIVMGEKDKVSPEEDNKRLRRLVRRLWSKIIHLGERDAELEEAMRNVGFDDPS